MTRIVVPDRGCVQTDVGGRRYHGNIFEVESSRDVKRLKEEGFFEASLGGVTKTSGYQCEKCGRFNYIRTCGRCASRAQD